MNALAVQAGTVIAGGAFSFAGGAVCSRVASIDAVTGTASGCSFAPDNVVRCLILPRNALCIGGNFDFMGSIPAGGIGYFGELDNWSPYPPTAAMGWGSFR
ncbi:MAG: hypothetical protein WCK47_11885 [bacterium]